MEKIVRYGKASSGLLQIKRDFFTKNADYLDYERRLARLYVAQPRREHCMCCATALRGTSFVKLGVPYVTCARCSHLNGAHRDTDEYCTQVYSAGDEYGRLFYTVADRRAYDERTAVIYTPKVEFLASSLREHGEAPEQMRIRDLGAGSGYLVNALLASGFRDVAGYEVSAAQVEFANATLGRELVHAVAPSEIDTLAATVDADVVTLIGTLEHLQRPREFMAAIAGNRAIKYLLISVPLFSPSVFFEMVFPEVMQRQLSGGHTHLYTESSLSWMAREYSLEPIAEWWFGTDLVDLYRAVLVELERRPDTAGMVEPWGALWAPMIDELQLVLDRRKHASEVHVLYRVH
jgi:hypothetical protein